MKYVLIMKVTKSLNNLENDPSEIGESIILENSRVCFIESVHKN